MFTTLVSFLIAGSVHTHKPVHAADPVITTSQPANGQIPLSELDALFNTSYSYTKYTKPTTYTYNAYGGYVYVSPTLEVKHYGYTYGSGKRRIAVNETPDGTKGRTVIAYVPDTSGSTPTTSIRRDFAPAIKRYKLHVVNGTTLTKTVNTSGGFQQFAGKSAGWTK